MLYRLFVFALLVALAHANIGFKAGETVTEHHDKTVPRPAATAAPMTNAQRFALGLGPAEPRSVTNKRLKKPTKTHRRTIRNMNKRAPCRSGAAAAFPPAPTPQYDAVFFRPMTDDALIPIELPFDLQIFDKTQRGLIVTSNGLLSFDWTSDPNNGPLPAANIPSYSIMPFWDDSYMDRGDDAVRIKSDDTSLSIRYTTRVADDSPIDYTVYYTTSQPGVWFVYYTNMAATALGSGSSATIGGQGGDAFVQYSYNTPGVVSSGTSIAIDTSCSGTGNIRYPQ